MGQVADALRATADLPPEEKIEALLATVQTSRQPEVAAAAVNLASVVRKLQNRNRTLTAALQTQYEAADYDLPGYIDTITATLVSNAGAVRAVDTYNNEWFRRLPYSPDGKKQLALEMLAQVASYGHRPPVWINWSQGRGE